MPAVKVALILLCSTVFVDAGDVTVFWSSDGIHESSNGSLLDSSYIFDVGSFDASFVPSSSNTDQWRVNWTSLGKVYFNPDVPHFFGSAVLSSNAAPFTTSAPVYIWGYNLTVPQAEWVLITKPTWLWPDTNSPFVPSPTYSVLNGEPGHTTVVGEVNQGGVTVKTAAVNNAVPPQASFDEWVALNFSAAEQADSATSGQLADPDNDGKSNFLEYALATNPTEPSADMSLSLQVTDSAGGGIPRLTLQYNPQAEVDVVVEQSVDLGTTQIFAPLVQQSAVEQSAGYEVIDHTLPIDGSHMRDFYRIRFSLSQ